MNNPTAIGFTLSLVLPSIAVVEKYLGLAGIAAYVIVAAAVLGVLHRHALVRLASAMTVRQSAALGIAAMTCLWLAFAIGYPIANSGRFGTGSDRDEALNIATHALLQGRYPYDLLTYAGNAISPMPGALLLAIPFVLIGNGAYQNLLWLILFFCTLAWFLRDSRTALLVLLVILAVSPVVMQEFVTGGDLLANTLYVLVSIMWVVYLIPQPGVSAVNKTLVAIAFGVVLCSRVHFWLLLAPISVALIRRAGPMTAIRYLGITLATLMAVTLPWLLYDLDGYHPLRSGFFDQYAPIFPYASPVLTGACAGVALLSALPPKQADLRWVLRQCTLVLLFPVCLAIVFESLQMRTLDLRYAGHGLPLAFFGATAFLPAGRRLRSTPAMAAVERRQS